MKYTFVPLVILKNSPCPWTRLTFIALPNSTPFIRPVNLSPYVITTAPTTRSDLPLT